MSHSVLRNFRFVLGPHGFDQINLSRFTCYHLDDLIFATTRYLYDHY